MYRNLLIILCLFSMSCDSSTESDQSFNFDLTEFALQDINPNSTTYGSYISLSDYSDNVQIYYFPFKSTWGLCKSWFSLLNEISQEYTANGYNVFIAGIVKSTDDSSIDGMVNNNPLPYLQDGIAQGDYTNNVWSNWEAADRDLYIINKNINWEKVNLNGMSEEEAKESIKNLVDEMLQ